VLVVGGSLVAVLAVAGAVAGAVAVVVSRHRDVATAASVDGVLERFRESATSSSGGIPTGVYTYATSGSERVSALGGAEHRYPPTSTITVTAGGCGPTLRWDVLTERWSSWSLCRRPDGQAIAAWSEHHQFFGQDDATDWTCRAAIWSAAGGPLDCRSSDTTETGTTTVEAPETLLVGTTPVPAVHLRTTATESGGARGTLVEDRWLEPRTGLPVRLSATVRTTNASPIGDVAFTETSDLRLTSLEPRR
jgi:hypothetical protein